MRLTETAYAKINLALHVRKRREDGYHVLETLFAFVDAGDVLTAQSAEQDRLTTVGEFATTLSDPFGNIVAKALSALPRPDGLAITLEKNLPVAAGLGGGSADAGAVFRIIRDTYGLPEDWRERAARLGADVPACVDSDMHIGLGVGDERREVVNDMAGMAVLLVNPRVPLSTGAVFKAWNGKDLGPLPMGSASEISRNSRNDLRPAAVELCPPIVHVLEALKDTDSWMCEMSGSGATCFALYEDVAHRDRAAQVIAESEPQWWQMKGQLR
ncbi:4-(cytidine 5'-diphospho)-2-C-methyl-D-erythritol kinase [Aurantiacibacter sp. D1-12]|uniref:4-(cytidine 5'-diphospho)-2-C-methyl-D-erythritol kinase n=1 Tax=Aurantiacibacter sp. D1-12 TaxID=2993658 RepID=UPI00237CC18D|nr:4-(cytidine 5'-diphospho)-2-C-methyl-D-erythritol kinase [Aurantiacibacter sp. D1-12]MDE1466565.1 4-(cytidine 5'-diphospho)-2-C-methyl-D-erythritol kinase [Aurantiacibacter sp. D1-12]